MPERRLTVEDRVGQLFWIGFHGTSLTPPLRSLLDRIRPGALILFTRNIEAPEQLRSLTEGLSGALRVPPFVALDQEGGRVNRLRSILGPIPSSLELASRPDAVGAVGRQAGAIASALRVLGFNVNFAPVLDLSGADAVNGIGDRSYGEDPDRVARLAAVFLQAHRREGVIPVGKHFPGLGSARADTHLVLPRIDKPRERIWAEDLLPYRRLKARLPIVMAGHAHYPSLQGRLPRPATLSAAIVERLLRRRLGFRGLVLTDDLEMGAVDQEAGAAAQALAALEAGNDGLMFCGSEDKIVAAFEGVLGAVRAADVDPARVARSLSRVRRLKARCLRSRPRPWSPEVLERSRRTLAALGPGADAGPDPTARA